AVVVLVELRDGVDGLESDEFGQRVLNKRQLCLEGRAGLARGRNCVICHGIQGNAFSESCGPCTQGVRVLKTVLALALVECQIKERSSSVRTGAAALTRPCRRGRWIRPACVAPTLTEDLKPNGEDDCIRRRGPPWSRDRPEHPG